MHPDPTGLLADLARPEAYPEPQPTTVSLITTHISWVFVTDHEVWKLKRPVDYGFVDYTTLDRRRHFCHEEVRVNRRLAPDVYLGVVPVRLHRGRHAFTSNGTVVDYAVRMRRIPETASAEDLLRRGALTHEHLACLAGRLAAFYATSAPGSGWGSIDVLRANVDENFAQVRPFVGRFLDPQTFEAVRRWQLGCLAREVNTFEARREQGRIRDGHGDLRLEHVYFERDPPIVIDAIEFNERFRIGDVAADVAFLAMELDARSRPDLAASFLAAFSMEADDYGLYAVLDFYLSYRAWVRGKIAAFLAADPSTGPEKAKRKAREADRLFALARAYSEPRHGVGAGVAVGGLIGAGKSTLARSLGRSLGFPVIDSDRTRKALAGVPATQQAPPEAYTAAFTHRTYDELFLRADVVLGSGRGVILDATFRDRNLRLRARELADRHRRPFRFVEAICDDTTLRTRLRARAAVVSVSDATEGLLDQVRREFEPVTELAAGEHVPVNTTLPLSTQIQAVRDALEAGSEACLQHRATEPASRAFRRPRGGGPMSLNVSYTPKQFNLSGLKGISDKTLEMHFKLYEGYVKETNRLTSRIAEFLKDGRVDQEEMPAYSELTRRLGFEYNGMVLHEYYFGNMTRGGSGDPAGRSPFVQAAERSFGSYATWKTDFVSVGKMRGVGWAICYQDPTTRRLSNHWITLHEVGNVAGFGPVLVLDVWEHAFILDYPPAERPRYIEAFFANIAWDSVERRLLASVPAPATTGGQA